MDEDSVLAHVNGLLVFLQQMPKDEITKFGADVSCKKPVDFSADGVGERRHQRIEIIVYLQLHQRIVVGGTIEILDAVPKMRRLGFADVCANYQQEDEQIFRDLLFHDAKIGTISILCNGLFLLSYH